jgi:hypothetical protein
MLQAAQHTQVVGVVDDRLDPVRPAVFQYCLIRECLKLALTTTVSV